MRRKDITAEYIAGFVDGEGCFSLTMRRDIKRERKSKAVYYSWKASFIITLRLDDKKLLELIQKHLQCGSITSTKTSVRFQVSDITELVESIIPFFTKNQLLGKKGEDFTLWAEAVKILSKYKKERGKVNIKKGVRGFQKVTWNKDDILKLKEIHSHTAKYKAHKTNKKWIEHKLGREK